jgi:hypothetical protein
MKNYIISVLDVTMEYIISTFYLLIEDLLILQLEIYIDSKLNKIYPRIYYYNLSYQKEIYKYRLLE